MAEAAARARREAEAAATAAQRLRALQEGGSEGVGEGEGEGELGGPLDAGGQRLAQRCRSLALELRFHIAVRRDAGSSRLLFVSILLTVRDV